MSKTRPPYFHSSVSPPVQPSGVRGFNSCALSYLGCQYTSRISLPPPPPPFIPRANHVSCAAASAPSPCNLSNARPARYSERPTYLHHSGFSLTYKTGKKKKKKIHPGHDGIIQRARHARIYFNNRMSSIYKFNAPVAHAYMTTFYYNDDNPCTLYYYVCTGHTVHTVESSVVFLLEITQQNGIFFSVIWQILDILFYMAKNVVVLQLCEFFFFNCFRLSKTKQKFSSNC